MGITGLEWRVAMGSDIQVENGDFTRIHNDILMALSATRLNGMEWSALMFIFRQTYGWQKKSDTISYSQFAEAMGVKRHHVMSALQKLEERNIIVVIDNGPNRAKTYSFNKYVETWDADSMRTTVTLQGNSLDEPVTPQRNTSVTPQGNATVTPQGTHKRKKENERKGEEMPPVPLTGDPYLDAATRKYNAQQNGQAVSGRQIKTAEWNRELPIAQRGPIANAIATVTGKLPLWEAGDERTHDELHQNAITAYRMGYETPESIAGLTDAWRTDWRGAKGGSIGQFLTFLSEQKTQAKQAAKQPRKRYRATPEKDMK